MKLVKLEKSDIEDLVRIIVDITYIAPKDKDTVVKYSDEFIENGSITERKRDILKACVKRYKRQKNLEYITSPESETYWCS